MNVFPVRLHLKGTVYTVCRCVFGLYLSTFHACTFNNCYLIRVCFVVLQLMIHCVCHVLMQVRRDRDLLLSSLINTCLFISKTTLRQYAPRGESLKDMHNVFICLHLSELFRFSSINITFEAAVHLPNLEKRRKWRILTLPKTCDYLKENTDTKCAKG